MLDEDGGDEGKARESTHERPDVADAVRQGSPKNRFLRIRVRHGVYLADEGHHVVAVGRGGA